MRRLRILRGEKRNRSLRIKLRNQMTPAENRLWMKLRMQQLNGLKFRRQHGIGPYIVDFYCPEAKLVIEVDGDVHADEQHVKSDRIREEYLKELGLFVVRYMNNDVLMNLEGVLQDLYRRVTR